MWYAVSRTTWGFLIGAGWVTFVVSLWMPAMYDFHMYGYECAAIYLPMWIPNLLMLASPWLASRCFKASSNLAAKSLTYVFFFSAFIMEIVAEEDRLIGFHVWIVSFLVMACGFASLAISRRTTGQAATPFDELPDADIMTA